MNILYDYQAFQLQNFGGISKSFVELISSLPSGIDATVSIKESNNVYLKEKKIVKDICPLSKAVDNFFWGKTFRGKTRLFELCNSLPFYSSSTTINRKVSIDRLRENKFDIFHPTYFDDYYLKYIKNKPIVLTIHDMIPELYYGSNDYQVRQKKKLVHIVDHIIAVSENTKKDIINILGVPQDKISVVYHGISSINWNYKKNYNTKSVSQYFLYVGQRSGYKNFFKLLSQTQFFFKKNRELKLVCTGNPFTVTEMKIIEKLNLSEQVFAKFVTTNELNKLYQNAIAFIYPSDYEGFGIPILEAFSQGCPVLLNKKSCFPEIGSSAALYFNMDDESDCVIQMEKMISMTEEKRSSIIRLGYLQASKFSWEISAKKMVNIYNDLL